MNSNNAGGLEIIGVTFGYGPTAVVRDLNIAIPPGEFFTLLGPSGCGKTTVLQLIGGYVAPAAGRIIVRGKDITDLPPEGRNAGMVFQNYALFPHLTARQMSPSVWKSAGCHARNEFAASMPCSTAWGSPDPSESGNRADCLAASSSEWHSPVPS